MKTKFLFTTLLSFYFYLLSSQVPQGFNYQAIARDGSGNPITGATIKVKLSILTDSANFFTTGGSPADYIWEEEHTNVKTNAFGLFTIVLGDPLATKVQGTAASFSSIPWSQSPLYVGTKIANPTTYKIMGSARLWSVPYSMIAGDLEGAVRKLAVVGEDVLSDEALFEVKRKDGETMFAVYNHGVRVFMPLDTMSKSRKGGFAIGGFDKTKGTTTFQDYFVVNPDSIRAYIDTNPVKARKGGFAIGGFDKTKAGNEEYLRVTRDSTRIYLNDTGTKARKGGFAIGGFDKAKGSIQDFLTVSTDSIRMFIDDTPVKARKGGFAIGGFDKAKGGNASFLNVATDASGVINPSQNRILWYPLKNAFLTGKVLITDSSYVGVNSFATGYESKAKGRYSQAMGFKAIANGDYSTAIGKNAVAEKINSFAFGEGAYAGNEESYAIGRGAIASGFRSFAFGSAGVDSLGQITGVAFAKGDYSIAIGQGSQSLGLGSFTFGLADTAIGIYSVAMGYNTTASGFGSISLGVGTKAIGSCSLAAGYGSSSTGNGSASFGIYTTADYGSAAFGSYSSATGSTSFAAGYQAGAHGVSSIAMGMRAGASSENAVSIGAYTYSYGNASLSMGYGSKARKNYSVAIGQNSTADGISALAMGTNNLASGDYSSAFGNNTVASGRISTAIGTLTRASGIASVAMGDQTNAVGISSVALGTKTSANGDYSFAAGNLSNAQGNNSVALGFSSVAGGSASLAGGAFGFAVGESSFSFGTGTMATGKNSVAMGEYTTAPSSYETVIGRYNSGYVPVSESLWDPSDRLFVIGNGTGSSVRSNAMTVLKNGNIAIGHSSPTQMLDINGNARFRNVGSGTFAYNLNITSDGTLTTATSDISMKKNVVTIGDALQKILEMNGVYFSWKNDNLNNRRVGFIAQEMEYVLPEVVFTNPVDGLKGINYAEITSVLVQAVKEQQKQIELTKLENQQLKSQVQSLQEKIEQIEAFIAKGGIK